MKIKLTENRIDRAFEDSTISFNINSDDKLVRLTGDLIKIVDFLSTPQDLKTLCSEFGLSHYDAKSIIDILSSAELIEGIRPACDLSSLSTPSGEVKLLMFKDLFPEVEAQEVYASYCACNCCSYCDNCGC